MEKLRPQRESTLPKDTKQANGKGSEIGPLVSHPYSASKHRVWLPLVAREVYSFHFGVYIPRSQVEFFNQLCA